MRNLESSYEIKGVEVDPNSNIPDSEGIVNPNRRAQIGGKKLFMSKENGVEKFNNYQTG